MNLDFSTIKKGYKVFHIENYNQLRSWTKIFDYSLNGMSYKYRVNDWTYRHDGWGPFALFESLEDAIRFRDYPYHIRDDEKCIYQVLYTPSNDSMLWLLSKYGVQKFDPFIMHLGENLLDIEIRKTTVFADAIYVIEKHKE